MDAYKNEFERTISPELFKSWKKLRKRVKPDLMAIEIGVSRPLIDRALNFGHVMKEGLAEAITEYFKKILEADIEQAKQLNDLSTKLKPKEA